MRTLMAILMTASLGCHTDCEEKVEAYRYRLAKFKSGSDFGARELVYLRQRSTELEREVHAQAVRIAELEQQLRALTDCR